MADGGRKAQNEALAKERTPHVVVIGGGYCGLAAAYELGRLGLRATVLEKEGGVGGLAGTFAVGDTRLEKFYHHWFTHDVDVMRLIEELDLRGEVQLRASRTGAYYAHNFFKLSNPMDLLRFKPLPLVDRVRLGLLALRVRRVRNWQRLENRTAADWLRQMGGERAFRVVWEPLLRGKFGDLAEEVAAVWFWNKLKLRGSSRGPRGAEHVAYFTGGFAALADAVVAAIRDRGGDVRTNAEATGLQVRDGRVTGVVTRQRAFAADAVVATTALPIVADLATPHVASEYARRLRAVRYLANICVVLEMSRRLSDIYWLNVADPSFPFVGVIEHTNLEPANSYAGRHIAYLSRYLPTSDPLYNAPDGEVLAFTLHHLRRMFPNLDDQTILARHVWRAPYAQPVVTRGYGQSIPDARTPLGNFYLATMAQIYPEDRGTNYAIRQGRDVARTVAKTFAAGARQHAPQAPAC